MEKILSSPLISPNTENPALFERHLWERQAYLCGIDEVGRGCLAGPVVACAAILLPFQQHKLLVDSKILTEKNRLKAAEWLYDHSWYSFGIIEPQSIDRLNIYKATQLAMKKALYGLFSLPQVPTPNLILIDAMPLALPSEFAHIKISSFPKGESKSISIAAASILAKVKRDELMNRLTLTFPGYDLSSNKGYGTKNHYAGLKDQERSLIHRVSFLSKTERELYGDQGKQTSLC